VQPLMVQGAVLSCAEPWHEEKMKEDEGLVKMGL
jgi:hypothetical protein